MHIFGGHVSIAGGYKEALPRVHAIGGNALQMFSGSPRGWNLPKVAPAEAEVFRAEAKKLGIIVAYFHASYLVNLADDGPNGKHSVDALVAELTVAEALGVRGSIIHLGSFKEEKIKAEALMPTLFGGGKDSMPAYEKHPKYALLISNIKAVLKKSPKNTFFIIEDMGMRKIGRSLDEIANIVKDVDDPRVKVCLDTCHLHAAGYDISTKKKLDEFLEYFDTAIGLDRLECFHVNDSRDEFGSLRDRHDNIGEGKVGKDVFKLTLNHPKLKTLPFILEVPGFDDNGPDQKNMNILKSLTKV
ncbi:MAG: deoxyribonuclease IV [bacterium]|nr:deoxyribonuclease IV [bacterium]